MAIKRTQVCFDIRPEVKDLIKSCAKKRNISMNLWIIRAIDLGLKRERESS